jgi:hypothetical protein
LVQVPVEPASAHDWQRPVQALLQQKPCAQNPELQSVASEHAPPSGTLPQLVPLQTLGEAQSALVPQVVLQAPEPQAYGAHEDIETVWQVPVPLQARAGVSVVPLQVAGAHWIPAAYSRQAPAPLHQPSVLQEEVPRSVHWPSGSAPFGTLVQAPTVPPSAHDWQVPPQALLQQNPWAQNPEPHSALPPQATPIPFFTQLPPMQKKLATQSVSAPHDVLQAPVPHWYGLQEEFVAAGQVPMPSQARAEVSVEPVQLAVPQETPLA